MKKLLTAILLLTSFSALTTPGKGLRSEEVKDMVALCCSYTFLDLYGDDQEIIPVGYEKIFTSRVMGLDNIFQVYKGKGKGVINFRGSTAKMDSWLENFYASMIPAKGKMSISGVEHQYKFAEDDSAAIHSGYAYAIVCLAKDLTEQIKRLNNDNIYDILLTGHSQGGALAQVAMSYLQFSDLISDKNGFKTYAFASPMVGDKDYKAEYTKVNYDLTFNIVNPEDLVPKFPLSYNDSTLITREEVAQSVIDPSSVDYGKKTLDMTARITENWIEGTVKGIGNSVLKQINRKDVDLLMPDPVKEVNYFSLDEIIEVPPAEYPFVLLDSSILDNEDLMAKKKRGENGEFIDDELYKKEPTFFQHKVYNYYVSVLKMYYPEEYERLDRKILPENL